jgi:hypothetical protein
MAGSNGVSEPTPARSVKPSETAGRLICRKVLGDHSAVRDRFNAGVELNADPVSQRNAIFHIEEKCCIAITSFVLSIA